MLSWLATTTSGWPGAGGSPTVFRGMRRQKERACTAAQVARHLQ